MALPFLLGISIHSVGPHDPPETSSLMMIPEMMPMTACDLAHAKKTIYAGIDAASDGAVSSRRYLQRDWEQES